MILPSRDIGIDVHKTESQVAVFDELGEPVEEVRVKNANLDEIAQKYAGNKAAIEAGSNYFTIDDRLDESLDVTLANPSKADWLDSQKQKNDRKDAKNLARFLRMNESPESYVPPMNFFRPRACSDSPRSCWTRTVTLLSTPHTSTADRRRVCLVE